MSYPQFLDRFWQDITGWAVLLNLTLTTATLIWVLNIKREPMSAIAWCLTVVMFPFGGPLLFVLFGYQTIHRRIVRKQRRKSTYGQLPEVPHREPQPGPEVPVRWRVMAKLAAAGDGYPVTSGNRVALYHHGGPAFEAMLEAIRGARHHVHMQFFIVQPDDTGRRFLDALVGCAKRGVQVRFLYDSVGSWHLSSALVRAVRQAGGQAASFLPVFNPLNRFRINLRNHRKLLIVDGTTGFTGGLNIGDEYLGLHSKFGYWRDTHLRVEGPGVNWLQRVFLEDWFFATDEAVRGPAYFREQPVTGGTLLQVVHSGPDAEYKAIRETYFAGVLRARKRLWIASPYCVPDAGLLDALVLAGRAGVDVRFLGLFRPDKWLPFLAARYYWAELLEAGVKVYQYARGMMHSKYVLVDGEWASIGTANMDNRSLHLNFEVNCLLYDPVAVAELEKAFLDDLDWSVRLDPAVYAARPLASRLAENAARLFSPVL
jgi:cardiolipin synthase